MASIKYKSDQVQKPRLIKERIFGAKINFYLEGGDVNKLIAKLDAIRAYWINQGYCNLTIKLNQYDDFIYDDLALWGERLETTKEVERRIAIAEKARKKWVAQKNLEKQKAKDLKKY